MEHAVKEEVIAKQSKMLQQMYMELRAVKTCLEVPRFRAQIPRYDFKGMDFKQFTTVFGQMYQDILSEAGEKHLTEKSPS